MTPGEALKHHVTGAIERGEKEAIVEQRHYGIYKITDQAGNYLGSGQTRQQVVQAIHRLLGDECYRVPRLPAITSRRKLIIALPIGKYLNVTELHITVV